MVVGIQYYISGVSALLFIFHQTLSSFKALFPVPNIVPDMKSTQKVLE